MTTANGKVPHTREQRIAFLRRERGYFAGFGQAQKVKAVDVEIAKLRAQEADESRSRSRTKRRSTSEVETATADVSSVESASVERR